MVIYCGSIYVVLLKAIIPTYSFLSSSYLRSSAFYTSFAARKEISDSSILCISYFVEVQNSLP